MSSELLEELGEHKPEIILGNTYHLALQPGTDSLEQMGGLHKFASWRGNILTDSGGFQMVSLGYRRTMSIPSTSLCSFARLNTSIPSPHTFPPSTSQPSLSLTHHRHSQVSLLKLAKITEEGVEFLSPFDGTPMLLTPEQSIKCQNQIGSDIMVRWSSMRATRWSHHRYNLTICLSHVICVCANDHLIIMSACNTQSSSFSSSSLFMLPTDAVG